MLRGAFVAALLLGASLTVSAPSHAQESTPAGGGILIFDRDAALRESQPARRLAEAERAARRELSAELDQLRLDLEAEEAEISKLRETGPREAFEERVRLFDRRVRDARLQSQQKGEALQSRFSEARRRLAAALSPFLQEMLAETGASIVVDARNVLAARPGADLTAQVIQRIDAQAEEITSRILAPLEQQ